MLHRTPPSILTQLFDLILIQLSNWRWSWRGMLITGMIVPLGNVLLLSLFTREQGVERLAYLLTGNVVFALMFENIGKVASNFAFMRMTGTLYYFATLPIRRFLVVVATLFAFGTLALPSLIVTVLVGALLLGITLHLHPLLLLVVPLITIPLGSLGALIGTITRSFEETGSLTIVITFAFATLGPVLVPPDLLHPVMRIVGWASPATYAASALRQTLLGPVTERLVVDVVALSLFALAAITLVVRRMQWRIE